MLFYQLILIAPKLLKDREGQKLNFNEIIHYHKILKALSETVRILKI